jgi:hypothetical protein
MNLDSLRKALQRQPFQAFTIRLADQRAVEVRHPEFVAVGNRVAVIVAEDDSWSVVESLLIVSIDYDAPQPGNGKKPKRGGQK